MHMPVDEANNSKPLWVITETIADHYHSMTAGAYWAIDIICLS